jgi:hypothetical protein
MPYIEGVDGQGNRLGILLTPVVPHSREVEMHHGQVMVNPAVCDECGEYVATPCRPEESGKCVNKRKAA